MSTDLRISLKPFNDEHTETTYSWISTTKFKESFLFYRSITIEEHKDWYKSYTKNLNEIIYAIYSNKKHVGNLGFKDSHTINQTAEFWIYLGEEFQGRGIGSIAIKKAITIGFMQLNLRKIYLHVNEKNLIACRLYEKINFKKYRLKF